MAAEQIPLLYPFNDQIGDLLQLLQNEVTTLGTSKPRFEPEIEGL